MRLRSHSRPKTCGSIHCNGAPRNDPAIARRAIAPNARHALRCQFVSPCLRAYTRGTICIKILRVAARRLSPDARAPVAFCRVKSHQDVSCSKIRLPLFTVCTWPKLPPGPRCRRMCRVDHWLTVASRLQMRSGLRALTNAAISLGPESRITPSSRASVPQARSISGLAAAT